MRRSLVVLVTALGLLLGWVVPASAYEPVRVVHAERVQAGPYGVTVGFSTWPVRAMRSLDFTFAPDGGIAGKSGVLELIGPDAHYTVPLARHPRKREVWGLDTESLRFAGNWTMRFTVDGPAGKGVGEFRHLDVLEQPGPPFALSWSVSTLPLLCLIALIVVAWRRTRTKVRAVAA
ncbi:hypothetical protein ACQEVC_04965 [Plantactinospora sp. CA-294935]|uniref:hypothetical protein n=1 Tax=Plantactinospora sp. CA-294935 TaxID=3240012 RepID=UPI003D89F0A7